MLTPFGACFSGRCSLVAPQLARDISSPHFPPRSHLAPFTLYRRILEENEKLSQQLERSKTIMKVSQAADELTQFCLKTEEPLHHTEQPNPWHDSPTPKKKFICC
eukprot:TRINITY_DN2978_c0_g2_i3.p1 TRINITY_DN2978_c0_g2~~TRINITY_DN2978_c0_g2_i3.p1  ORF type:complete len:105 (+),score=3.83 TRINITY_DN2978_c0_g2_i3:136-450(+)